MTNLLIASFNKEIQAIEASRKLTELELSGDITIYERVLLKKRADGTAEILQADITHGVRSISGMSLATLIGIIGGPVGMAAGILSGTLSEVAIELGYFGFSEDFGKKVVNKLEGNDVAVIAEVDEENPVFINGTIGGMISRTNVQYAYSEYSEERIEAIDSEIAAQRIRIKSVEDAEKILLEQKIIDLKEKRRRKLAELERRAKEGRLMGRSSIPGGQSNRNNFY